MGDDPRDTDGRDLTPLLWPRSVAVIGASADPTILRGRLMATMGEHAFPGRLHPVSRSGGEILGRPAVTSIAEVPEPVDLAVIMVPAEHVPAALDECGRAGVRAALVISSGFAEEAGGGGRALQDRLAAIARDHGMILCGPNAEGFANTALKLAPTFSPALSLAGAPLRPEATALGSISVIAQSGGIGFSFYDRARPRHIPVGYVVTTGNEADLETADILAWLVERDDTDVVILFLETVKSPAKFIAAARRALDLGKPIVAVKVGGSEAGARAAFSHTAALAGSDAGYRAVFRSLGIVEARTTDHAVDLAVGFAAWRDRLPAGRRVGIFTASGGAGGWMADRAEAAGLSVPELDTATRAAIDPHLPPYGTSINPVDATAQAIHHLGYAGLSERVAGSPLVDAVVAVASTRLPGRIEQDRGALAALKESTEKPVVFWSYTLPHDSALRVMTETGFPMITDQAHVAEAIAAMELYRRHRALALGSTPEPVNEKAAAVTEAALAAAGPVLVEAEAKPLLAAWGIARPAEMMVTTVEDAVAAARDIGTPVALKVQSPDLPHKSEHGVLALGLDGDAAVAGGFLRISANAERTGAHVIGVLVQAMAPPGIDLILGVSTDETFGPMLTVGLGGVFTEILADSVTLPCPVAPATALAALRELRAWPVLAGARGTAPRDVAALAGLMATVSAFAARHADRVTEIDLNPVVVLAEGEGYRIVDALMSTRRRDGGTAAAMDPAREDAAE